MRRCRPLGQVIRTRILLQRRSYSEYAPAPPSPADLKAPLPEKYSVGKNLKLKAVLFEYDFLSGSASSKARTAAKAGAGTSSEPRGVPGSRSAGFRPLTPSGESLVDEIAGLLGKARTSAGLGGDSLQDMGRTLIADLKEKMGSAETAPNSALSTQATPRPAEKQSQEPINAQDSDPKAKYLEKLRRKTGGRTSTAPPAAGDADLLFAARERVAAAESPHQTAWMLRQGAGDLLLFLAARSVRLGVIAGPRTTPQEFDSFAKQLGQQSIRVWAAVSPADIESEGVEASVERARGELSVMGGSGSEVLVVGSSEPILRAATAAEMYTARHYPPNSRREGVIQTFIVRDIDEVRTVVEELNGVSFR